MGGIGNLEELSEFLGFAPQHIFYLVKNASNLYFEIRVPKRSNPNDERVLSVPITELKGVQKVILSLILERVDCHKNAYAYVQGRSVVAAAKKLCGKKNVLRFDLRNFFPSITDRRIFGLYESLGFNKNTSYMLTKLTSYKGALCQGAPTSPYISNLICRQLDYQLSRLADTWRMDYLRYSDDMYFYSVNHLNYRRFSSIVDRVTKENGFHLNEGKTKYFPKGKPRYTLGLVTHGDKPRIPRKERMKIRAAFFKASTNIKWAEERLDRLSGMAEWYKAVHGVDDNYVNYREVIRNVQTLMLHETYSV